MKAKDNSKRYKKKPAKQEEPRHYVLEVQDATQSSSSAIVSPAITIGVNNPNTGENKHG